MAAFLHQPELSSLQASFTGFHEPSYVYSIQLPMFDPFRGWERDFQWTLCTGHHRYGLDDPLPWLTAPDQEDPEAQQQFLLDHNSNSYYGYFLARAAYNAAVLVFRSKQALMEPACSVYVQSELSVNSVFVCLVLGGPGLNKYSAQGLCRVLQLRFWEELCGIMDRNLQAGVPSDRQDALILQARFREALARTRSEDTFSTVTLFTYLSRSGSSQPARVQALEFCVNYLLCKNARYHWEANPIRNTLASDWFTGVDETYMATLVNGEAIPLGLRKQLWQSLQAGASVLRAEPVFAGEMFGRLPQVRL
uniref:Initiator protein NS1 n=1 Tax=Rhinolophus bat parvovirus TaxID=3038986 RepID=A0AAU7E1E9_9VIRU